MKDQINKTKLSLSVIGQMILWAGGFDKVVKGRLFQIHDKSQKLFVHLFALQEWKKNFFEEQELEGLVSRLHTLSNRVLMVSKGRAQTSDPVGLARELRDTILDLRHVLRVQNWYEYNQKAGYEHVLGFEEQSYEISKLVGELDQWVQDYTQLKQ